MCGDRHAHKSGAPTVCVAAAWQVYNVCVRVFCDPISLTCMCVCVCVCVVVVVVECCRCSWKVGAVARAIPALIELPTAS